MVNVNHNIDVNAGKKSEELPLEHIFCFRRSFKKIAKGLRVHFSFKPQIYNLSFTQY